MQYQMINDLTEEVPESALEFKASYFKANKQVSFHIPMYFPYKLRSLAYPGL